MTAEGIQGLGDAETAALWRAARELVAWADLVAVSGKSKRFEVRGNKVARKSRARKTRKERAA